MLNIFQSSRSRSHPIHLYLVEYGLGESTQLRMTDAETNLIVDLVEWQSVQIRHGEINASGALDKAQVEIGAPITNPLTEVFRLYPPSNVANITIFRGEHDDPEKEFTAIWSGRIIDFSIDATYEAKFICEPIATSVRRPGLRRNYQYGCPHVLYGPHCRANKAAGTVSGQIAAITASVIVLEPGWNAGRPLEKFQGGLAEWLTIELEPIARTILRVASDGVTVTLSGVPTELKAGKTISLSIGCNHQQSDCRNIHNNILNYGGCPWIPLKNPISNYNSFY